MKNIKNTIRTDADVASADELVQPVIGSAIMRTGVFDAVPQPDRGKTRA